MPLFSIRRHVGDVTKADLDAASFRAIVCGYEFPDMEWIRSFWDEEAKVVTCYYVAKDADEVREHSRRSNIPFDEVHEVSEFGPKDYSHLAAVAKHG